MTAGKWVRRGFLRRSMTPASAALLCKPCAILPGRARTAERKAQPIRLGGPAFAETLDPEELALAHRKLGYSAAYCPNVSLSDSAKIHAYADAFAKHDVVIAEVGRWINLLDADAEKRRFN